MDDHQDESANLLGEQNQSSSQTSENIQQVVVKWENLTFEIEASPKPIEILKGVSGFANPKEIFAIMGPSGCGKTTLLSLLSDQLYMESTFKINGNIWLNAIKQEDIKENTLISYIPQENILYEILTPYEFLKFTLSLKVNYSESQVKKRVDEVLDQLKLTSSKHNTIGGFIVRGLSGGEKKRLSIASEVLLYPSVLILDEPTSGLDSFMAKSVINILKDLSKSGVTVIMTIHQPSYEIYEMIDRIALMQCGEFVYQGRASEALNYFKEAGLESPPLVNPPEFFMKVLRIEDRNHISEQELKTFEILSTKYNETKSEIFKDINQQCIENKDLKILEYDQSLLKRVKWLFWRELINLKRNPFMIGIKIGQIFMFSLILNMLYFQLDTDEKGIDDRRGALIVILFVLQFIPSFTHGVSIASEARIVRKEIKEGLYNYFIYYLEKLILEIPIILVITFILVFATYYVIDLNQEHSDKVFRLYIIGIVDYLNGFAVGILASSIAPNPIVANFLGATLDVCLLTFSGFFNDPESSPTATNWLRYLAPFYYLRNAALINEFDDLDMDSDVILSPDEKYNYDHGTYMENVLITFIHFFGLFFLTVMISYYQVYRSRVVKNN